MPLVLTYFDMRGRAEFIRYILAKGGKAYEDKRVDFGTWGTLKPTTPLGCLPLLEVDGKMFNQSLAIARYIANETGLAGKNNLEKLECDMIVDTINDLVTAPMSAPWIKDEGQKAALVKKYLEETLPNTLPKVEARLGNNKFFLGDTMSWADIYMFYAVPFIHMLKPDEINSAPKLKALHDRVEADPKIAEWIKKRPKTDM